MTDNFFDEPPHIQLLQWLARGSLKQNLLKSLRLWVELKNLYGTEKEQFSPKDSFTYYQWRDSFFHPSHPKGEAIPGLHDPSCPCQKTVSTWLFQDQSSEFRANWEKALAPQISPISIDVILKEQLFKMTRRTLQGDFYRLADLGWLIQNSRQKTFKKVSQFPSYPQNLFPTPSSVLPLLNLDLEMVVQNLCQPLGGHQRFFLEVDYIITAKYIDAVEDWQDILKTLWQENPTPPIGLTYRSVQYKTVADYIVYPVCLYYVRRAIYLCAMGQTPHPTAQWYNFRLDKIENLSPLTWKNPDIPDFLLSSYPHNLPTPHYIQDEIEKAWGFDFYLEATLMLLRFNQDFHQQYIQDTHRHETFKPITYKRAQSLIKQYARATEQTKLLQILGERSPEDAYYQVYYRDGDINVQHRLFSWRPHVESLLPWKLRTAIAGDVNREYSLYF